MALLGGQRALAAPQRSGVGGAGRRDLPSLLCPDRSGRGAAGEAEAPGSWEAFLGGGGEALSSCFSLGSLLSWGGFTAGPPTPKAT